jgi:hypothetical protein
MGNTQNAFEGYIEQIRLILEGYSRLSREQRIEKFISTIGWSFDGDGVKMEPYKDEKEIEIGVQIEDAGRGGESILCLRYDVCDTSDEFVIPMLKLKFDESPKVMVIDDYEDEHSMDDYHYGSGLAAGYDEVSQYLKDHLIDIEIADFEDYVKEFELDYESDEEYDEDDDSEYDEDYDATDDVGFGYDESDDE